MPTLVIAVEDALVVATAEEGGKEAKWRTAAHLRETEPRCVAADPHRPARLYCGTFGSGLWRSDDAGGSWMWMGSGVPHARITAVTVSASEERPAHGVVYAGTEPSAVYRSEDGGQSWAEREGLNELPSAPGWSFPPRPDTHHVRWVECDPVRAGRLWVAIEAGALIRSRDRGRSWEDRVPGGPRDTHTLATHPAAPGRLYSAAGDGYFESGDAGETWHRPDDGLEDPYLVSVAVDPRDPDTVVVSAAPGPWRAYDPRSAESRIWRRTRGSAWRMVGAGLPAARGTTAAILAAQPLEPEVFYAANNRGVFRSGDAGLSWEPIPMPWPYAQRRVRALAVMP